MPTRIEQIRRFYAELILKTGGSSDARLISAFASVPREDFLGKGPWQVFVAWGYISTPTDDPALLYQDIVVGLVPERGINNGQPTLHARALGTCAVAQGETVVHVGAGTGYYSAVLATLTGPAGRVIAFEIDPDLAQRASINLRQFAHVTVRADSATSIALPECDVLYVSAGATHPLASWLDALKIGGRLVFPLTPNEGLGVMLMITRAGPNRYTAKPLMRVAFIPCIGASHDTTSASFAAALDRIPVHSIRSLRRNDRPDESAWCVGSGWWLSTVEE